MNYPHEPVLLLEAVKALSIISGGTYVDCTVGSGGHSEAIARKLGAEGRLLCLDRDPDAVHISKNRLGFLGHRLVIGQASFANLADFLQERGIEKVHGVLLDLGMSSDQLEKSGRGFSFRRDEPLDMRMDPGLPETAYDLVNNASTQELESILREYGEEKRARRIVKRIVRAREGNPIRTSLELAELIKAISPVRRGRTARHPATKTFQALRIAVNHELEQLVLFLERLPGLVREGGRVVIISYHSLEDRIVKQQMEKWEHPCTCPPDFPQCVCGKRPLFIRVRKRAIRPGSREIARNPRARSAVMRVAERVLQ
ncbi:MAG: 16S rRNA (cytosine(1402)-N(4))-methyltransferase RsmH [Deltaproteobacteria bacterium]|nr:16S rRNA (cytosine(1402)-N(4))-methyltransferase RsmH [Deltaproteobacteria bacterium]